MGDTSVPAIKSHAFNRAGGTCECIVRECNHPRRDFFSSMCKNKLVWEHYGFYGPTGWDVLPQDTDEELAMENSILLCADCIKLKSIS